MGIGLFRSITGVTQKKMRTYIIRPHCIRHAPCGRHLFQKPLYPGEVTRRIRKISHRQIHPCGFIDYASIVRKGIKAVLTVIPSHARGADAAESNPGRGQMYYGIIDTAAPE